MKKTILIASACICCALSTKAQVSIAPEAGLNLANATLTSDNSAGTSVKENGNMKPGLKAGFVVDIPVAGGFFVQPGLFYSMKGVKTSDSYSILNITYESTGSFTLHYLEVPVNLGYKYTIGDAGSIFVTAGPYLGYAISGTEKETLKMTAGTNTVIQESSGKIGIGSNTGSMKRLDFGLNFSAGYQLPMGLYFRAQYGLGLGNLTNTGHTSYKNKVLAFSLGYAFPIGG